MYIYISMICPLFGQVSGHPALAHPLAAHRGGGRRCSSGGGRVADLLRVEKGFIGGYMICMDNEEWIYHPLIHINPY